MDDVAYPMAKLVNAGADVEATWNALSGEWSAARASGRARPNPGGSRSSRWGGR